MEPDVLHPLRGQVSLPIDRVTPDPFSEGSTEMPKAPFHLVDLEDARTTPMGASQVAASADPNTELVSPRQKCSRPDATGGASGEGSRTSVDPKRPASKSPPSDQASGENPVWDPEMSYQGLQVRRRHSVKDDVKVAFTLMNGMLLPRNSQELPKDLKAAL